MLSEVGSSITTQPELGAEFGWGGIRGKNHGGVI